MGDAKSKQNKNSRVCFGLTKKMDEDLFAAFESEDTSSVLKKEKRGDTENTENTDADALVASIIGSGPSSSLKREHSEADENDDDSDEDEEKDTKKLKIDKVDEDKEALSLVEAAPRITIHTLDTPDSCTHEVAVPPNQDYVPLRNPTPC